MKKIILLCLLSMNVFANECKQFSDDQIETMQRAFDYGKQYDYGWTLAAIAWKESSAGKAIVNFNDPSFGPFHIHLKTAAMHEGLDWNDDPNMSLKIAQRLLNDFDYGASHAVSVLDYWKKQHNNDYRSMLASYNAGYNWKGTAGQAYSKDVAGKVNFLMKNKCIVWSAK